MIAESVVRATVIHYLRDLGRGQLGREQLQEDQSRGFVWLEEVVDLLGRPRRQRQRSARRPAAVANAMLVERHSSRSTRAGSRRAARRAGSSVAAAVASRRMPTAPETTAGS